MRGNSATQAAQWPPRCPLAQLQVPRELARRGLERLTESRGILKRLQSSRFRLRGAYLRASRRASLGDPGLPTSRFDETLLCRLSLGTPLKEPSCTSVRAVEVTHSCQPLTIKRFVASEADDSVDGNCLDQGREQASGAAPSLDRCCARDLPRPRLVHLCPCLRFEELDIRRDAHDSGHHCAYSTARIPHRLWERNCDHGTSRRPTTGAIDLALDILRRDGHSPRSALVRDLRQSGSGIVVRNIYRPSAARDVRAVIDEGCELASEYFDAKGSCRRRGEAQRKSGEWTNQRAYFVPTSADGDCRCEGNQPRGARARSSSRTMSEVVCHVPKPTRSSRQGNRTESQRPLRRHITPS